MKAVIQTIRILIIIQFIEIIRCQNFGDRDILRFFSLGNSEEQVEPVTGYSANGQSKDANSQAVASLNLQQYQVTEDLEQPDEYSRADYARTKKLIRIKNPFQQQSDVEHQTESNTDQKDGIQGASNQYALQFSLPPDDFIQKLKAENQYYQQQQSTPQPNTGYAVTPLPQYQFSTVSTSNHDSNNQQPNQIQYPKLSPQNFLSNGNNNYQYSTPNTLSVDNVQSTLSPYAATPLPNNNQFVGTASNPYVSSSFPLFLSSPQNIQSFVSSPYSQTTIQSASVDYNNNRGTPTAGNNFEGYDNNDLNKRMQVEYYDNSVNGVKYPVQQYQNEYQQTTPIPASSPYNAGVNALSKSLQELSLSQVQNFPYSNNQQDIRSGGSVDNYNNENQNTNRAGNIPTSNFLYNYIQQDYQNQNKQKNRPQEGGQETGQTELYSNGDFGWKLAGKKIASNFDGYSNDNIKTYHPSQSGGEAISQVSFHMDTGKHYNYDQISKATSDNAEAQEFANSVRKPLERIKQQQQYSNNNYQTFNQNNQQPQSAAFTGNGFQDGADNQRNKYNENSNIFSLGSQSDLVTASPIYNFNSREVSHERANSFFDHAKALKAIVPIDVSNVAGNSEYQGKNNGFEGNNRFSTYNLNKENSDQNFNQYNRPIADAYYKDKNSMYGFNIKSKPEDYTISDNLKQFDHSTPLFSKQQQALDLSQNIPINFGGLSPSLSYPAQQEVQNNQQSHRFQNPTPSELGVFKVNDGPYRFTHGLSGDSFRFNNNHFEQSGIPSPIPGRINQNLNSHQLDVPSNLLNNYPVNKPQSIPFGRPDSEGINGLLPTINGFKVANPFNVDLKLVADVLKGKPTIDETHLLPFRDQFNKASPPRLDLSQLQLLLKNENIGNLGTLRDNIGSLSNTYFEPYNNGRFQGVKYSRSQEEEENIPITDTVNNPFIGAVIDQENIQNERELGNGLSEVTGHDEESITSVNLDEEKHKKVNLHRVVGDKYRHPNAIGPARRPHHRKRPRATGHHPSFKPSPFKKPRNKIIQSKMETLNRKRRLNKPPMLRIAITEPIYEANTFSDSEDTPIPILLRPPPQVADDRSDTAVKKPSS